MGWVIDEQLKVARLVSERVMERDGARCQYCGKTERLIFEHIYPESRGGPYTCGNITLGCPTCNAAKGTKLLNEWKFSFDSLPEPRPTFLDGALTQWNHDGTSERVMLLELGRQRDALDLFQMDYPYQAAIRQENGWFKLVNPSDLTPLEEHRFAQIVHNAKQQDYHHILEASNYIFEMLHHGYSILTSHTPFLEDAPGKYRAVLAALDDFLQMLPVENAGEESLS